MAPSGVEGHAYTDTKCATNPLSDIWLERSELHLVTISLLPPSARPSVEGCARAASRPGGALGEGLLSIAVR